jgi:heptose-I-phosphate ethanolaminephosphotransferase
MNNKGINLPVFLVQVVIFILIISSPLALNFYFDINNFNNSHYDIAILTKHFIKIVACFVLLSVVAVPFLFIDKLNRKIYSFIIITFLYIPAIIDFCHVLLYKTRINAFSWYSVFGTDKEETLEFISDYSSLTILSALLFAVIIPLLIYRLRTNRILIKFGNYLLLMFICIYTAAIVFIYKRGDIFYVNELSTWKAFKAYRDFRSEINKFTTADSCNLIISKKANDLKKTFIIVIGESTSRYHMQLYGYSRKTNPELEKIKNKLIIFKNVNTSRVHTIASLTDILMLRDSSEEFLNCSLIDLYNKAGLKTYWLSNQPFLGENETLISAMTSRAQKKIYISSRGEKKFDEELLPELQRILADNTDSKVIFIHLMGTHLSYQDRYPSQYNYFTQKNISVFGDHADSFINHYDNAVLYNDHVIALIAKEINAEKNPACMIYFSDHGDEVYDMRDFHGHSSGMLSEFMKGVPFIIYANASFNKLDSVKLKSADTDAEYPLKNVSSTLQDLMEIRFQQYDSTKSYFAKALNVDKPDSDALPTLSVPFFHEFDSKIWAHRVNSIERLGLIEKKFEGIELDVVFENGKFDVRHPPAESVNLSLDEYFKSVKEIARHSFWLDVKNIDSLNENAIINYLDAISGKYGVKQNIIVETSDPSLIPGLTKAGYTASYYLPDFTHLPESEIMTTVKNIYKSISMYQPAAISQNIENYNVMHKYFGAYNKLLWTLTLNWNDESTHQRIVNLLNKDSTIKVCLVNYETAGWR